MKKIYIGIGHGGDDPGAVNGDRLEKDDNLRLGLALAAELDGQDCEYMLSRDDDENGDINTRCSEANSWGADYFLELHRDSSTDSTANGATCYVYSQATDTTYAKGEVILKNLVSSSGFKSRGVIRGAANYTDYGVNKYTNMHSCLLECGFISSSSDNELFDENLNAMARALAKAVLSVVGVDYVEYTVEDARNALLAAIGTGELTEDELYLADLNGDDEVSLSEARTILRRALGLD